MANKVIRLYYLEGNPEDKYTTLDEARKAAYTIAKNKGGKISIAGDRIEVTPNGKVKIIRKKVHLGAVHRFDVNMRGKIVTKIVWDTYGGPFMPWLTSKGTIEKAAMDPEMQRWEKIRTTF